MEKRKKEKGKIEKENKRKEKGGKKRTKKKERKKGGKKRGKEAKQKNWPQTTMLFTLVNSSPRLIVDMLFPTMAIPYFLQEVLSFLVNAFHHTTNTHTQVQATRPTLQNYASSPPPTPTLAFNCSKIMCTFSSSSKRIKRNCCWWFCFLGWNWNYWKKNEKKKKLLLTIHVLKKIVNIGK